MGNLGELWFTVGLQDNTDKAFDKIKAKLSAGLSNESSKALAVAMAEVVTSVNKATSSLDNLISKNHQVREVFEKNKKQIAASVGLNGGDYSSVISKMEQQVNEYSNLLKRLQTARKNGFTSGALYVDTGDNSKQSAYLTSLDNQIAQTQSRLNALQQSLIQLKSTGAGTVAYNFGNQNGLSTEALKAERDARLTMYREMFDAIAKKEAKQAEAAAMEKVASDQAIRQQQREASEAAKAAAIEAEAKDKIAAAIIKLQMLRGRISLRQQYSGEGEGFTQAISLIDQYIAKLRSLDAAKGKKAFSQELGNGLREATAQANLLTTAQAKLNAEMAKEAAVKRTAELKRLAEAERLAAMEAKKVGPVMGMLNTLGSQLSSQLAMYFSVYAAARFVHSLIEIGGEFQKQRLALTAMIGDSERALEVFDKLKVLAVKSPFQFKDLTAYAKQLTAFSVPTNELYDTTKRLADISAGLGVDMSRIVLAFGQVRAASYLRGQELRQYTEAGVNLLDELAKKFTQLEGTVVTTSQAFDRISQRRVPFKMVKDILFDMTKEGGKFFNMQEILSQSLSGKFSNLKDAYQIMLDQIATANNDILGGSIDSVAYLMRNWETLKNVLATVIATYGAFKIASISTTATTLAQATATQTLAAAETEVAVATNAVNAATKRSGVGLAVAGIVAAIGTIYTFLDSQRQVDDSLYESITLINKKTKSVSTLIDGLIDLAKQEQAVNEVREKAVTSQENLNKANADGAGLAKEHSDALSETSKKSKENADIAAKRAEILVKLNEKEPELAKNIKEHADNLAYLTKVQKEYNDLATFNKEAHYAVRDTNGLFSEEITTNLQDLNNAEFKADAQAQKLGKSYTQLVEAINKMSEADQIGTFGKKTALDVKTIINSALTDMQKLKDLNDMLPESFLLKTFGILGKGEYDDNYLRYALLLKSVHDASDVVYEQLNEVDRRMQYALKKRNLNPVNYKRTKEDEDKIREYVMGSTIDEEIKVRLLTRWNISINGKEGDPKSLLEGWRKELDDLTTQHFTPEIIASSNIEEVIDVFQKKYKELKETLEQEKPMLVKFGFDFKKNEFKDPTFPWSPKVKDTLTTQKDEYLTNLGAFNSVLTGLTYLNSLPKEKENKKDPFTEALKKQLEIIKSAISAYNKLIEVEGKEAALGDIRKNKLYADVNPEFYKEGGMVKAYDYISGKLGNRSTDEAKSFREELKAGKAEAITDEQVKLVKDAVNRIATEIEKNKAKFDLFKKIYEITGDSATAAKLSGASAMKDYITFMKEQFDKMMKASGLQYGFADLLAMSPEKIKGIGLSQTLQKTFDDIKNYMDGVAATDSETVAKILTKHEDLETKLVSLTRQANTDIAALESKRADLGDKQTDSAIAQRKKDLQQQVADAQFEAFKDSSDWAKAFGDLGDLSNATLTRLIKNLKYTRDTVKGMDVKNFKELVNTIKKLEKEQTERNPWLRLKEGINDYIKAIKELAEAEANLKSVRQDRAPVTGTSIGSTTHQENAGGVSYEKKDYGKIKVDTMSAKQAEENYTDALDNKKAALNEVSKATAQYAEQIKAVGDAMANLLSYYNQDASDMVGFISDLGSAVGNAASSAAKGDAVGTIKGVMDAITSVAAYHDKKLDRAIERSQIRVKQLKNQYDDLSKTIERQLGAVTGRQANREIENLKKQQDELRIQKNAELDKKKTDASVVEDLNGQIAELSDTISHFYEDLFNEEFGASLKDWASQISEALVNAFANGENAAMAFDNTVGDILKNLTTKMIQLNVIEPAMTKVREYLFGSTNNRGEVKAGVFSDGEMSTSDLAGLTTPLMDVKKSIGAAKTIWDTMNQAAKDLGLNLAGANASGIAKGIQGVTEDTADLLGSYINAIRQDVSVKREYVRRIAEELIPLGNNQLALQLAELKKIEANTLRSADGIDVIKDTLNSVVNGIKAFKTK